MIWVNWIWGRVNKVSISAGWISDFTSTECFGLEIAEEFSETINSLLLFFVPVGTSLRSDNSCSLSLFVKLSVFFKGFTSCSGIDLLLLLSFVPVGTSLRSDNSCSLSLFVKLSGFSKGFASFWVKECSAICSLSCCFSSEEVVDDLVFFDFILLELKTLASSLDSNWQYPLSTARIACFKSFIKLLLRI